MTYPNYESIPDEILIKIFSFITNDNLNNIYNSLLVSKRYLFIFKKIYIYQNWNKYTYLINIVYYILTIS